MQRDQLHGQAPPPVPGDPPPIAGRARAITAAAAQGHDMATAFGADGLAACAQCRRTVGLDDVEQPVGPALTGRCPGRNHPHRLQRRRARTGEYGQPLTCVEPGCGFTISNAQAAQNLGLEILPEPDA